MNTITTAFGGLGNFGTYLNCIPALEVILLGWGDVIQVKLKELVITNFVPLVMQSSTPSTHQHTPTQHAHPSTPTPTPHTHTSRTAFLHRCLQNHEAIMHNVQVKIT